MLYKFFKIIASRRRDFQTESKRPRSTMGTFKETYTRSKLSTVFFRGQQLPPTLTTTTGLETTNAAVTTETLSSNLVPPVSYGLGETLLERASVSDLVKQVVDKHRASIIQNVQPSEVAAYHSVPGEDLIAPERKQSTVSDVLPSQLVSNQSEIPLLQNDSGPNPPQINVEILPTTAEEELDDLIPVRDTDEIKVGIVEEEDVPDDIQLMESISHF